MSVRTPSKRAAGRPIEHPDSPLHQYWREQSRRYYWRKKKEKKAEEDEKVD